MPMAPARPSSASALITCWMAGCITATFSTVRPIFGCMPGFCESRATGGSPARALLRSRQSRRESRLSAGGADRPFRWCIRAPRVLRTQHRSKRLLPRGRGFHRPSRPVVRREKPGPPSRHHRAAGAWTMRHADGGLNIDVRPHSVATRLGLAAPGAPGHQLRPGRHDRRRAAPPPTPMTARLILLNETSYD